MRFRRISAAAERLGVHANTLRSLEKRGVIAPKRDWNGYRIFSERDIEEIEKKLFSGKNHETSKIKRDQRAVID